MIEILGLERRKRRSPQDKMAIVQQSFESGMSVSMVAHQHVSCLIKADQPSLV